MDWHPVIGLQPSEGFMPDGIKHPLKEKTTTELRSRFFNSHFPVLLEYSDKEAYKIIMNRMRKDRMVYSRLRSTEAWKDLERAVESQEKKEEAQSLTNLENLIKKNKEVTVEKSTP